MKLLSKGKLALLGATLLLAGCGASGPKFTEMTPPSDGNTKLYVYRSPAFFGAAIAYHVHANDMVLGKIVNGSYLEKELTPGKYEVWAKTEVKRGVDVELVANTIQCVKSYVGIGWIAGRAHFDLVPLEQCLKEIVETRLTEPVAETVKSEPTQDATKQATASVATPKKVEETSVKGDAPSTQGSVTRP